MSANTSYDTRILAKAFKQNINGLYQIMISANCTIQVQQEYLFKLLYMAALDIQLPLLVP